MMNKILLISLCFCLALPVSAKLVLASGGQSSVALVIRNDALTSEKFAMEELQLHLQEICSCTFQVFEEDHFSGDQAAIYLGDTRFARENGIDSEKLGEEAWLIRSIADNLLITGGRPRGVLYAVYEFLEREAGCKWLAFDCSIIPEKSHFEVTNLDYSGEPAIPARDIYRAFHLRFPRPEVFQQVRRFEVRNRNNSSSAYFADSRTKYFRVSLQQRKIYPKMGGAHTMHAYVPPEKYFKEHPEYFPMNAQGERFCGPAAHLCLSNPDVRRITVESLRTFIKADLEESQARKVAPPNVYDISQMDGVTYFCKCPECTKISTREGGEGGLLVDYMNYVAEAISEEYPDIMLRTFAYVSSDVPPKNLKVNDQIIIWFCDLYGKSDCYRPLDHEYNLPQLELIRGWCKVAKNVQIWDYWNMEAPGVRRAVPEVITDSIAADMKIFRSIGIQGIFAEAEEVYPSMQSFMDLNYYLGLQMMLNPDLDSEAVIADFIAGYYGKAAQVMKNYFEFLRQTIRDTPHPFWYTPPYRRDYVSAEFLLKCHAFLQQARELAQEDSALLPRLAREEVTVYNSMLGFFNQFQAGFKAAGWTRELLIDQYQKTRQFLNQTWCTEKAEKRLQEEIDEMKICYPRPDIFADIQDHDFHDFTWNKISGMARFGEYVDDPDAESGRAYRLGPGNSDDYHKKVPVFGNYDQVSKIRGESFHIRSIPDDERYHWYRMPPFQFLPATVFWGHWTWHLSCNMHQVYISPDGLPEEINLWTPWISAKFTGPDYVPGSQQENAIYLERIILTRPDFKVSNDE